MYLEGKATGDALELLDLLMTADLLAKAERESEKGKVRRHPQLARGLGEARGRASVIR